jgi:hypothetical protein
VAIATKVLDEDKDNKAGPTEVMRYKPGGFFGELALITDQPRAANVVALEDCKCVTLDRDRLPFTPLLSRPPCLSCPSLRPTPSIQLLVSSPSSSFSSFN